jgi:hypothetical protein
MDKTAKKPVTASGVLLCLFAILLIFLAPVTCRAFTLSEDQELAMAERMKRERNFNGAAAIYRRLLASHPENDRLWYALSRALEAGSKFPQAITALRKAGKINPQIVLGGTREKAIARKAGAYLPPTEFSYSSRKSLLNSRFQDALRYRLQGRLESAFSLLLECLRQDPGFAHPVNVRFLEEGIQYYSDQGKLSLGENLLRKGMFQFFLGDFLGAETSLVGTFSVGSPWEITEQARVFLQQIPPYYRRTELEPLLARRAPQKSAASAAIQVPDLSDLSALAGFSAGDPDTASMSSSDIASESAPEEDPFAILPSNDRSELNRPKPQPASPATPPAQLPPASSSGSQPASSNTASPDTASDHPPDPTTAASPRAESTSSPDPESQPATPTSADTPSTENPTESIPDAEPGNAAAEPPSETLPPDESSGSSPENDPVTQPESSDPDGVTETQPIDAPPENQLPGDATAEPSPDNSPETSPDQPSTENQESSDSSSAE